MSHETLILNEDLSKNEAMRGFDRFLLALRADSLRLPCLGTNYCKQDANDDVWWEACALNAAGAVGGSLAPPGLANID